MRITDSFLSAAPTQTCHQLDLSVSLLIIALLGKTEKVQSGRVIDKREKTRFKSVTSQS